MLAPVGFFQELTAERYAQGRLIADQKQGALRFTFPMSLLAAALTIYGARAILAAIQHQTMLSMWLAGGLLVATGIGIAVVWLLVLPRRVKTQSAEQYARYRELYGRTAVSFTQDDMILKGEHLTRTVAFAKTRLCVETPTLFVIFTDDDAVVLLDKDAFETKAETSAFLRDVFARWYKKKGTI